MSNQPVRLADVLPRIEQQISAGFSVSLAPQGTSMQPMLYGGRDSVILSPVCNEVRIGDILFFRYGSSIILHRAVKIENGLIWCRGDHRRTAEGPIRQSDVIAVVTAFTRKGKYREVSSRSYRIYWHLLPVIRPVFLFLQKVKRHIRKKRAS